MKEIFESGMRVPILSWCEYIEPGAMEQAENLSRLPFIFKHFALMADGHQGYGMPIGGVAAFRGVVSPNCVGVDIGCGMGFIKTDIKIDSISSEQIRKILGIMRRRIPAGEGHARKEPVQWIGFEDFEQQIAREIHHPEWMDAYSWNLTKMNLGTLGGGNHFMELQATDDGYLGLMLHSGSRNLGHKIASYHHKVAVELNRKQNVNLPTEELAFLSAQSDEGYEYLRDMQFALRYAQENRRIMMDNMKYIVMDILGGFTPMMEVNIHHNYTALEEHMGASVWVHRKGATSAKKGEIGIIPGSMGSSSYIVRGRGCIASFMSCSHGAGRKMGRNAASDYITLEDANEAMKGIEFFGWSQRKSRGKKKAKTGLDFGEAPQAYKDIHAVIAAQSDLVDVVMKLRPLGVMKG